MNKIFSLVFLCVILNASEPPAINKYSDIISEAKEITQARENLASLLTV